MRNRAGQPAWFRMLLVNTYRNWDKSRRIKGRHEALRWYTAATINSRARTLREQGHSSLKSNAHTTSVLGHPRARKIWSSSQSSILTPRPRKPRRGQSLTLNLYAAPSESLCQPLVSQHPTPTTSIYRATKSGHLNNALEFRIDVFGGAQAGEVVVESWCPGRGARELCHVVVGRAWCWGSRVFVFLGWYSGKERLLVGRDESGAGHRICTDGKCFPRRGPRRERLVLTSCTIMR